MAYYVHLVKGNRAMIQISIYFIILLVILVWTFIKRKNRMGKILFGLYTVMAFFSVLSVKYEVVDHQNTTLIPYIFLILIFSISFYPFTQNVAIFTSEKLKADVNKKYIIFCVIFTIMSLITIRCYIPHIQSLIVSGNWAANRNALYSGDFIFPYTNIIEYIAMNFVSYTRVLALITGFVILRTDRRFILGITTILLNFMTSICSAIYTSSRGAVVNIVLLILAIYLFFFDEITKSKKKFISILIVLGIISILPYVIQVTTSRFGSNAEVASIVSYFGQPPIVFNRSVYTITEHLYGEYAWGTMFGAGTFDQSQIGGTWGSGFYTYVGWLYIDWGLIGTILVAVFFSFIIYRIIAKKKYNISDLFLVFFVYYTLLQGVFVIGRSYNYSILMAILIYVFVKIFFDKYTIVIGRIRL